MAIIGNPIVSTDFPKDTFSGNGSTTAFTMSIAPASVNAVIVVVSGITQDPSTYTISGTTLTFSGAPPTGTSNISVRHLGVAGIPNTPSAGSVGPSAINSSYSLWNLSGSDINYTAGNVGVGTASPLGKLHINQSGGVAAISQTYAVANFQNSFGGGGDAMITLTGSNQGIIAALNASQGAVPMTFYTGQTERMRIDSSGNVCLGTTNADPSGNSVNGCTFNAGAPAITANRVGGPSFFIGRSSTTGGIVQFRYNGADQGTISTNGSTTAYNSSSDYRLKQDIAPMTNALETVSALKPVTYKWKATGIESQGFIAHELQAIVPDCVTGEKDEIDAEGNPVYQGIDTSFLVATLTAAIQELNAKVEAQAAEIQALKGTV